MKKPKFNTFGIFSCGIGLIIALMTHLSVAQTFSTWNPQGANPQNPYTGSLSGTWESLDWDTASETGTNTTVAWVEGTTALFAANTGAGTPALVVTMNSGHTVAGIYVGGQTPGPCNVTINGSGVMTLPSGTQTFNVVSPGTLTITNDLTGSGALGLTGSGTLTLCGTNSFSGTTSIGSGCTLAIGGAGKLGSSGSYSATIDDQGAFTYNSSASQTLSGTISDVGALAVTGHGTLTLTAANVYQGGTTINSGSTLTLSSSGTLYNQGNITNNGTLNYNSPHSMGLYGTISGSGSLSDNPGGTLGNILTLGGANSYTGPTTIALAGQIVIYNDNSLGNPPNTYVPAQLTLNYGFLRASGTFTLNANRGITLGSGVPFGGFNVGGSIQVDPGQTLTIASPIVGTSSLIYGSGEVSFGFGTNLLANTNGYKGGTGISTGRLLLGTNGALPFGTTLIISADDSGVGNAGAIFDLGGFNQTIGPLGSTNTFYSAAGIGNAIPTVVLNGALTILQTNAATLFNGQIVGSGSLTINGNTSGTLTLSNYANTFTGGTIINGGTLEISTNTSILGNVTVNGGTLKLDNNTALASSANLTMASGVSVKLNFSGTQTIGGLNFGSTNQATGLWGAVGNAGATYTDSRFSGPGLLLVCPAPQTITAASPVCAGTTATASVPNTPGATYAWSVTNGYIISGGTSSTLTYVANTINPVILNCVVTSPCGAQSPGGQNFNVAVNICGLVVQSTGITTDPVNGATITGTGVIGAQWFLNASPDITAPLPWPTIQSGTISVSPFTVTDPNAVNYSQQFYYLTNSP